MRRARPLPPDALADPDALAASAPKYGAVDLARAVGLPHDPTPEQCAVIEAPPRPLLVVAGAGSGKTCLLYTSPSPRDGLLSRMPSSA